MEFIIDEFNKLIKVKSISKDDKKIVIPNGVEVIGQSCFFLHKNIEEIIIPNSVKSIERTAFQDCIYLKKITLSKSLKIIEESAFEHCKNLENIELPNSIIKIETNAFSDCYKLKEMIFPDKLKEITYKICNECANLTNLFLPKSVEFIEPMAFLDCNNIDTIRIDNIFLIKDPNIQNIIEKLDYVYFNKETNSFMISNQEIKKEGYEIINYKQIKKDFKCNTSIAVIIKLLFEKNDISKTKTINKLLVNIINDNYNSKNSPIIHTLKNYKEFELLINYQKKRNRINKANCYVIFKLAYSLGAFSDDKATRQRACEFLNNTFIKKELNPSKMNKHFKFLNLEGYKEEWAKFVTNKNNFIKLIETEKRNVGYISKIYNSFEEIKEFGRSNKGNQRYRTVTVEMCEKFYDKIVFKGINSENIDIAETLGKYTRNQDSFNEAVKIREKFNKLKEINSIDEHIVGEEIVESTLNEIEEERKQILADTQSVVKILDDISNSNFTYEFLSKKDPENYVLGKYCDCCAHIEGIGKGIAIASIINPNCQNIIIKNSKGKIISKSTIYVNRGQGYILLNSIQNSTTITKKTDIAEIYNKYIKAITVFIEKYNKQNPEKLIKQVNIGMNTNDLENIIKSNHSPSPNILEGIKFNKYTNYEGYSGDWQKDQYILWIDEPNKKQVK